MSRSPKRRQRTPSPRALRRVVDRDEARPKGAPATPRSVEAPAEKKETAAELGWWLWLPVVFAALVRTIHWFIVSDEPLLHDFLVLDSALYAEMARTIAGGDLAAGSAPFAVGPLYAYLLAVLWALVSSSNLAVFALQALVGVGSVALVTLHARRFGSERGACFAGLAWAAYAPAVMLESKLLGETYALGLVLVATLLLVREGGLRQLAGSALAFGSACLLRPDLLLFVPVAALWLVASRVRPFSERPHLIDLRRGAVWTAVALLVVSVATIRNYVVSGEPILISAQGGISFYQGNNPRAEGAFSVPAGFSGDKLTQEKEARAIAERELGRTLSHGEVNGYWQGRALSYLASDPGHAFVLGLRKLRYWLGSAELSGEYVVLAERCLAPSLSLALVPFGVFLAALVLGVTRAYRREPRGTVLLLLFVGTNLVMSLAFFVSSRYRLAAAAHLAIFVAPAYDLVLRAWSRRRPRDLVRLTAAGSVLAFSLIRWTDAERFQAAMELYTIGGKLYERRQFDDAIRFYLSALDVRPKNRDLRFNLGHAYAAAGNYGAAVEQFEKVVELDPKSAEGARYLREYRELARQSERGVSHLRPICEL